jgi:hypothetical protein
MTFRDSKGRQVRSLGLMQFHQRAVEVRIIEYIDEPLQGLFCIPRARLDVSAMTNCALSNAFSTTFTGVMHANSTDTMNLMMEELLGSGTAREGLDYSTG